MDITNWRAAFLQKHRYLDSVAYRNLFYGTAWKKEDTAELVYSAIKAGFRSIATASQPKHYREDLVGEGVRRAIQDNIVSRKDLYVSSSPNSCQGALCLHPTLCKLLGGGVWKRDKNSGISIFVLILSSDSNHLYAFPQPGFTQLSL